MNMLYINWKQITSHLYHSKLNFKRGKTKNCYIAESKTPIQNLNSFLETFHIFIEM